jgi:hypothetical protein
MRYHGETWRSWLTAYGRRLPPSPRREQAPARVSIGWTVWWTAFPDVLAFWPLVAIGLWLPYLVDGTSAPEVGHVLPRMGIRLPLYPAGHSLIVFLLVFGVVTVLARQIVYSMLAGSCTS